MDSLKAQVYSVVAEYAGHGLNSISYLTQSVDGSVLTITDFSRVRGEHRSGVSVVVRMVDNYVIIERDQNDKPVVDALVQTGIPRERIILAYAGEPVPDLAL